MRSIVKQEGEARRKVGRREGGREGGIAITIPAYTGMSSSAPALALLTAGERAALFFAHTTTPFIPR